MDKEFSVPSEAGLVRVPRDAKSLKFVGRCV